MGGIPSERCKNLNLTNANMTFGEMVNSHLMSNKKKYHCTNLVLVLNYLAVIFLFNLIMVGTFSFLIQVSEPESHVCIQSLRKPYKVISVSVVEFPRGS